MIYWQLIYVYLKIGLFGFGGGYAMLSLIQFEIVDRHHWLTLQQFTDIVAISQMTPGPIGINSATYIGYSVTGSVWGAVVATVAVCLPSFLMVLFISYFFVKFKNNKYVNAAMSGLLPMSVALIGAAALLLSGRGDGIYFVLSNRKKIDCRIPYSEKIARLILTLLIPFSCISFLFLQNINILLVKKRIPADKNTCLTQH